MGRNVNWDSSDRDCWNTSLQMRIENALSLEQFDAEYEEREEMNASGYGGSDSGSWLLALMQSLLLSIFIWQPLVMLIWTILSIHMFTWNLQISIPWNIPGLCKRCCCGLSDEEMLIRTKSEEPGSAPVTRAKSIAATAELGELARTMRQSIVSSRALEAKLPDGKPGIINRTSTVRSLVVSKPERPLDMISFLANDDWIIDDTDTVQKAPETLNDDMEDFSVSLRDSETDSEVVSPGQMATPGKTTPHGISMVGSLTMPMATHIEMQQKKDNKE